MRFPRVVSPRLISVTLRRHLRANPPGTSDGTFNNGLVFVWLRDFPRTKSQGDRGQGITESHNAVGRPFGGLLGGLVALWGWCFRYNLRISFD